MLLAPYWINIRLRANQRQTLSGSACLQHNQIMKPNDAIALIIALHLLILALVSYCLVRLFRALPIPVSTTYSTGYTDSGSGSRHGSPLLNPSAPPEHGLRVQLGSEVTGNGAGVGGTVNIDNSGQSSHGRENMPESVGTGGFSVPPNPGGRVNIDNR